MPPKKYIGLEANDDEKKAWNKAAKEDGRSLSSFIRNACNDKLKKPNAS